MRLLRVIVRLLAGPRRPPRQTQPPLTPQLPREMRVVVRAPQPVPPSGPTVLHGPCWVIDGDTIVIDKIRIRIAGIDAPELDHPFGKQSKWALVKLCKGQVVTARVKPELSYDRMVAECFLPDGRDLAAEMVRAGLALDWPKFSGGKYRHLETADARRKLWRASVRQRGMMGAATGLD
ncbi:thermonuclease family protein [uncultured Devosia sp.]|uniref:thermonuclease family protein n=1 Tax=uncultured Devosia sp. TaxID=211434 RepID=UPI0026094028|nr:thermonuclease family protein [uncultured Devosia sp.]